MNCGTVLPPASSIDAKTFTSNIWITALLLAGTSACGAHRTLVPAKEARTLSDAPEAAFAVESGVRCSVNGLAWPENGRQLPDSIVPIKVRVRNSGNKPIRVLYEAFVLRGGSGRKYRPVPVVPLNQKALKRQKINLVYASSNFYVARRFRGMYSGLEPWSDRMSRDEALYQRQYLRWGEYRPGRDIMRMALPEGVLAEGGVISGYLFFENPVSREGDVSFEAQFHDANAGKTVAVIEIPFAVQ